MALGQALADCYLAWKGWILPRKLLSALTTNAEPFHSLGRMLCLPRRARRRSFVGKRGLTRRRLDPIENDRASLNA